VSRAAAPVIHPGLTRVRVALDRLGHPEEAFAGVLIAGTNGKGSVAALAESALRAAGFRTGLYTSPHLVAPEERARVDGRKTPRAVAARLARRARAAARGLTEFEIQTLVAFLWFAEAGVDIAVLEAGLGGRWDATNAFPAPEASVITSIGHDHRDWLGPTLRHIYREKREIARPGTVLIQNLPCFLWPESRRWAAAVGVPTETLGLDFRVAAGRSTPAGERFVLEPGGHPFRIPFRGRHQRENAALAARLLAALRRRGWRIPEEAVRRGFAGARWPGRFEVVRRAPPVVVDGAHNVEAAAVLARAWKDLFGSRRASLIFACLRDKDAPAIARALAGVVSRVVTVDLPTPRSRPASSLAALWSRRARAESAPSFAAAWARVKDGPVLIAGSLYLAGMALKHFGRNP
jgi:dihydrofolate synthase/folylpolyglutamate synthase